MIDFLGRFRKLTKAAVGLCHPRHVSWIIAALIGVFGLAAVSAYVFLPDFRETFAAQRANTGLVVTDRNGCILRIFPDGRDRLGLWSPGERLPQTVKAAAIAAEDKRFFCHPGFDPIAIVRALYMNVSRGRSGSGASTVTQQVVRLITPRPRTYRSKLLELLESLKMEIQLSKMEILELYLNLAPMGGNIRGAPLAAQVYFGKDLNQITIAEAASLAALPRSPARYNPSRNEGLTSLMKEKDRIVLRMAKLGMINEEQLQLSLGASVALVKRSLPLEAPHLVASLVGKDSQGISELETSLDLTLQRSVEGILRSHAVRLRSMGIQQAGAIVASTAGPEVLALVGSLGYGDTAQGYNNAAFAVRGAGSTLKPFLYALALEQGCQPASEIDDTFRSYSTPHGDYLPFNADRRSYGPVNIRSALGNSLNISAVKMIKQLGVQPFFELLDRFGLVSERSRSSDCYGLGLAIGNLEVSLFELVQAYAVLANHGSFRPLSLVQREKRVQQDTLAKRSNRGAPTKAKEQKSLIDLDSIASNDKRGLSPVVLEAQVISPETAYVITHILADPTARMITFGNPSYFDFGFPVALKTGTSSNYRDAWIVGYTTEHVIGIWAGAFNGVGSGGTTGSAACGPILHDIIRFLYGARRPRDFTRPQGVQKVSVCTMSGQQASPACPYTIPDLVIGGRDRKVCCLPHHGEYHDLEAHYARWLLRREAVMGPGRFRLMPNKAPSQAALSTGHSARLILEGPGRVRHAVEIISPHYADRFIFSHRRENLIRFQAQTDRLVEHVTWLINGMEVARTPPPYEFLWNAVRGSHLVHAITPGNKAATLVIQVE